jgi:hypothetical protein
MTRDAQTIIAEARRGVITDDTRELLLLAWDALSAIGDVLAEEKNNATARGKASRILVDTYMTPLDGR